MIAAFLAVLAIQGSDSISLAQALERARIFRPRLIATAGVLERARATARLAALPPNPTGQFESDQLSPTHKLTAVQSLAFVPRWMSDRAAGRAGIARAEADSLQGVVEVTREATRAFYAVIAADRQVVLASEQALLADSLARLASRRAAAGDISDLERGQVALEASRARVVAQQASEAAALASIELARVIAWRESAPPHPSGALDDGLDATLPPDEIIHVDDVPFVRAVRADSAASAARLRAARLARIPLPGLLVGREWGGLERGGSRPIVGLAVTIPLWTLGNEAAAQARGTAREQAALADEARLAARAAIDAAQRRVVESRQRAIVARDSLLPEAQRVRAGAVRLYEEGRTSVLPVLDALRAERDVARTVVGELFAFQDARASLDAARGRRP